MKILCHLTLDHADRTGPGPDVWLSMYVCTSTYVATAGQIAPYVCVCVCVPTSWRSR